jgi:carbamoyltransferase
LNINLNLRTVKILSISGGLKSVYENTDGDQHDASAVLMVDGEIISAIEEERLNRIKHTDKFPGLSIKFVLQQGGLTLADIDQVCYYSVSPYLNAAAGDSSSKKMLQAALYAETGYTISEEKIFFVHHHLAHAVSAYYMSGFNESLILTIDGRGDGLSGMVLNGAGKKLTVLNKFSIDDSLGIYYLNVIHQLGYKQFDEYKVMGLAPYGNPETYRELFKTFYKLSPEGNYSINLKQVKKCYLLGPRREKDEDFNQVHKDIAAALQESVETIVSHILKYYKEKYNHSNLCLAGGVAHNCSMNGQILYSGLFENIFIQPASHDAGCALGAGLYRYHELKPEAELKKLSHLYWGRDISANEDIEKKLKRWADFIEYEQVENIAAHAARLMAEGSVIGWMQGKSEFGPRSLGNRSIVADPRPEINKQRINSMVKTREGYRPFAPSVMEEYVKDYVELPTANAQYPYMIFVQKVKEDKRALLGATTHVDGTARVQTVSKSTNERYWNLINEFRKLTGVAVVLNTSFNNNAEPIVDSEEDGIVCFLTTKLDYLVIGDYVIRKKQVASSAFEQVAISIPKHNILTQQNKHNGHNAYERAYTIKNNFENGYTANIASETFKVLDSSNGSTSLGALMDASGYNNSPAREQIIKEIVDLWTKRFLVLSCN